MSTLFVGLGRMGDPMARLHAVEHETVLLDADPDLAASLARETGCRVAPSVDRVPDGVDTVILMLPDSSVVESVLLDQGLLDRLPPGSLVIDMGSSVPASTRRLAERAGVGCPQQARAIGAGEVVEDGRADVGGAVGGRQHADREAVNGAVSYTHLTLPTNREV